MAIYTFEDYFSIIDPSKLNETNYIIHLKGYKCKCCNNRATHFIDILGQGIKPFFYFNNKINILTLDHIFPKSKGGSDNIKNLEILYYNCNNIKGNKVKKSLKYYYDLSLILDFLMSTGKTSKNSVFYDKFNKLICKRYEEYGEYDVSEEEFRNYYFPVIASHIKNLKLKYIKKIGYYD